MMSTEAKIDRLSVNYRFVPNYSVVARVRPTATIAELEREVGVYSASPAFVREQCGPIAVGILDAVPAWYHEKAASLGLHVNCDVRIHRLYPGDFPAYPGWHCDGEYRETYFSQPDLDRIKVHHHLVATVSSHENGVSSTEFLRGEFAFASGRVTPDHGLWQQVNDRLGQVGAARTHAAADGDLVVFDSWTLHRATPARIRGWRLFFRMSMWHKPGLGDGKVTRQEQVYKMVGDCGW